MPLNSSRVNYSRTPLEPKQNAKPCDSASIKPKPIRVGTSPHYHSPDVTVELIGRVNEANIFIGHIQVTALIDTTAQVSIIM